MLSIVISASLLSTQIELTSSIDFCFFFLKIKHSFNMNRGGFISTFLCNLKCNLYSVIMRKPQWCC